MITTLVDPEELAAEEAVIEGDRYRHLFRARRLPVGAALRLTDGHGRARWGKVAAVDKTSARVALGDAAPGHEAARRVELLVSPFRRERAAWLVEKATELGVAAVRFLATERAARDLRPKDFDRLRRVAASALEQSHRSRLPEITGVHDWQELSALAAFADPKSRWLLDTTGASPPAVADAAPAVLLIGSEGGWSDAERQHLADQPWHRVCFGERVLRVETAALAGAALLLCR
ncbi:MAG: RsmE family RNA methyltransferase [Acidobacteriota bacterium]